MKTERTRRCPPLVAFDVGVGRTYTALAVISRWSAERAPRPRVAPEVVLDAGEDQRPEARAEAGEQDPEQA